jgi:hypothetical protein
MAMSGYGFARVFLAPGAALWAGCRREEAAPAARPRAGPGGPQGPNCPAGPPPRVLRDVPHAWQPPVTRAPERDQPTGTAARGHACHGHGARRSGECRSPGRLPRGPAWRAMMRTRTDSAGTGWTKPASPGDRCLPCIRRPPPCGAHASPMRGNRRTLGRLSHPRRGRPERCRGHDDGTAASGQPPRESYCHACCWTTSFPACSQAMAWSAPGQAGCPAAGGPDAGAAVRRRPPAGRQGGLACPTLGP